MEATSGPSVKTPSSYPNFPSKILGKKVSNIKPNPNERPKILRPNIKTDRQFRSPKPPWTPSPKPDPAPHPWPSHLAFKPNEHEPRPPRPCSSPSHSASAEPPLVPRGKAKLGVSVFSYLFSSHFLKTKKGETLCFSFSLCVSILTFVPCFLLFFCSKKQGEQNSSFSHHTSFGPGKTKGFEQKNNA